MGHGPVSDRPRTGLELTALAAYLFICKDRAMEKLSRITPATLDVLEVLIEAADELHGFALAKAAHRPTGSVYLILSRLEEAGWVESNWETANTQNEGRPRRRFYRLTPGGFAVARETLTKRRSKSVSRGAQQWRPGFRYELLGRTW